MTYEIQEPDAPATSKQTWAIKCLGGGDVRDAGLTRKTASDMIGELKAAKETGGKKFSYRARIDVATGEKTVLTVDYDALWEEARADGYIAGTDALPTPMTVTKHTNPLDAGSPVEQEWHVSEGACGFADVNFSMKSGLGRKFGQWLIKNDLARKDSYRGGVTIWISDHGQSVERKSAHASALAKVLQEAGIADAYSSSRLD